MKLVFNKYTIGETLAIQIKTSIQKGLVARHDGVQHMVEVQFRETGPNITIQLWQGGHGYEADEALAIAKIIQIAGHLAEMGAEVSNLMVQKWGCHVPVEAPV